MDPALYPLLFEPSYRHYLWGGRRIPRLLHRDLPPGRYAESWEIADRREAMSRVANGPLAGVTLRELGRRYGSRLVGRAGSDGPFPLLFKILDADQRTSLQVHPGDAHTALTGGDPKTEFWYALPGMGEQNLFIGLHPGTGPAIFEEALRRKRVEQLLQAVPVQPGDAYYIPGGRVHAVDAGCFFFEVQQNSDTTYRIYDWDRTDENGEHRRLHIEEALQVIAWDDREDPRIQPERIERDDGNAWWLLKACPHFRIERVDLLRRSTLSSDGRSFRVVFVVAGSVLLAAGGHELSLRRGMTCLLPAALESCRLVPEGRRKPSAELLLTTR